MLASEFDREYLWHFRAQFLGSGYSDGDTMTVLADTGFGGRQEVRIRVADLWMPELGEPGGPESLSYLRGLCESPDRWSLRVVTRQRETIVTEVRSFERYVADVYVCQFYTDELRNVREEMEAWYARRSIGPSSADRRRSHSAILADSLDPANDTYAGGAGHQLVSRLR